jgi:aquaporin Z
LNGRAAVAEFIGTFALTFIGGLAIVSDVATAGKVGLIGVALAHGLALAIMISALGGVSGGHFNPAVTFALWTIRKIDSSRAAAHVTAQIAGAVAAALLIAVVGPAPAAAQANLGTPLPAAGAGFGQLLVLEVALTFFLMTAIMGTAVDPLGPKAIAGFGIGLVLVFNIVAAGAISGASMNPARSFGPALVSGAWGSHLVYWIGPIVGASLAAHVYEKLIRSTS